MCVCVLFGIFVARGMGCFDELEFAVFLQFFGRRVECLVIRFCDRDRFVARGLDGVDRFVESHRELDFCSCLTGRGRFVARGYDGVEGWVHI